MYSTKLAIEVLYDLKAHNVYNEQGTNAMLKPFLLKQLNKSDKSEKQSASVVEFYEMVELFKIIGFKNYKNL